MRRSEQIATFGIGRVPRNAREFGERIALRALFRTVGVHARFVPKGLRQQFEMMGIDAETLELALRNIRRPGDWPYAWEAEGDRRYAAGDLMTACACYYMAQRVLMEPTPLKRRLYELGKRIYARVEHRAPLEHFTVEHGGAHVAGLLQVPVDAPGPVPAVVMVPGISATKEEFHVLVDPLLDAGFAVARIDNPGFGDTTGLLTEHSPTNPAAVVDHLRADPRIDGSRIHLYGSSMGGMWAAQSACVTEVASVVLVAAPFATRHYFGRLPSTTYTALRTMAGPLSHRELWEVTSAISMIGKAHRITAPVRLFHGEKDGTVPPSDARRYERELTHAPRLLTLYANARHNCLEAWDDLVAETIAWLRDPEAVLTAAGAQAS